MIILYVITDDIVAAEEAYTDYLNETHFLRSKESETAELFINAVRDRDEDKLVEIQNSTRLNYIDVQVKYSKR